MSDQDMDEKYPLDNKTTDEKKHMEDDEPANLSASARGGSALVSGLSVVAAAAASAAHVVTPLHSACRLIQLPEERIPTRIPFNMELVSSAIHDDGITGYQPYPHVIRSFYDDHTEQVSHVSIYGIPQQRTPMAIRVEVPPMQRLTRALPKLTKQDKKLGRTTTTKRRRRYRANGYDTYLYLQGNFLICRSLDLVSDVNTRHYCVYRQAELDVAGSSVVADVHIEPPTSTSTSTPISASNNNAQQQLRYGKSLVHDKPCIEPPQEGFGISELRIYRGLLFKRKEHD